MTRTRQPRARNASSLSRSRATFRLNFSDQKPILVLGSQANRQPSCLCQKQPCTNTTDRYLGNTRSGRPGRSFRCGRKRNPRRCAVRRTTTSGTVSRPLIRDIIALRRRLSTMSVNLPSGIRRSAGKPTPFGIDSGAGSTRPGMATSSRFACRQEARTASRIFRRLNGFSRPSDLTPPGRTWPGAGSSAPSLPATDLRGRREISGVPA